jgi:probable aminopeptidase NPEPL1
VVALPPSVSRHNTPSRAHSITKIVSASTSGLDEYFVIVCEKSDVFASAVAVARAFPLYNRKSSKDNETQGPVVTVEFLIASKDGGVGTEELSIQELSLLESTGFAVRNAARIVDIPCSEMHTDQFVQEALQIAEKLGITPTIIRGEDLNKQGFGGIYGVGKAAAHPPALVVLSHRPPGAKKTVAWVGKGIVFDTGGLSIKDKTGMCGMKRDCGGASGILNAFYVAVKEGFKENLHAVLCLAENAVGPLSTRPDDILTMYSKKTVEINNTDAEGRLVLSDGVVYAKEDLKADIILDMATLTGAQGIATGKYHAALLTNSEDWETAGMKAGKNSGELVFPIVFAPELHFPEFNSVIADMKNSVKDRSNAQSSCAGLFILSHLGFDFPGVWMHVDIAFPAEIGDRATGYGVALLNTLFGHMSSNSLLSTLSPWSAEDYKKLKN